MAAAYVERIGLDTVRDCRRSPEYPLGYREHVPVLMFHKAMERFPRSRRQYRAESAIAREPFLRSEYLEHAWVRDAFRSAFAPVLKAEVDFLKFPQLALSIPFLLSEFPDCAVLAVWRNAPCTFRSLAGKEFPPERLPASLLRSFLMWRMYADHILRAADRAPGRVAVVSIDESVSSGGGHLREALRTIGVQTGRIESFDEVLDRTKWNRRAPVGWRALHATTAIALRMLSRTGKLTEYQSHLASRKDWGTRLRGRSPGSTGSSGR